MPDTITAKILSVAALLSAVMIAPSSALAAAGTMHYVSTSGSDAGNSLCSQAAPCATIAHAVSVAASGDTISIGAGTFTGGVTLPTDLTLAGAGAATVLRGSSGTNDISLDPGVSAVIEDLTVEQVGTGVAISAASGSLTLEQATVLGDQTDAANVAVAPDSGTASVSVLDSTIADAGNYGIAINPSTSGANSTLSVINSTIAGNSTGVIALGTDAVLRADTITANGSSGAFVQGGQATLADSILAGNGVDCDLATVTDGGHNLIGVDDASGSAPCGSLAGSGGNLVGTAAAPIDPMLGSLADNGGPTQTVALHAGSPAIGAGDPGVCRAAPINDLDQRGNARNSAVRAACDIGAFDTGTLPPVTTTTTTTPVTATTTTSTTTSTTTATAAAASTFPPPPGPSSIRQPPRVSNLAIAGVGRHRQTLSFAVQEGRGAHPVRSIAIRPPGGLRFATARRLLLRSVVVRGPRGTKLGFAPALTHGTLSLVLDSGSPRVQVTIATPAITTSRALARIGRRPSLTLAFSVTDTAGTTTRILRTVTVE